MSMLSKSDLNEHSKHTGFFPKLLGFWGFPRRRLALSAMRSCSSPKRDAARSNRAGDANPPKTLRFRGIPFPKTSSVELRFIIPCNAYYRCIYI